MNDELSLEFQFFVEYLEREDGLIVNSVSAIDATGDTIDVNDVEFNDFVKTVVEDKFLDVFEE